MGVSGGVQDNPKTFPEPSQNILEHPNPGWFWVVLGWFWVVLGWVVLGWFMVVLGWFWEVLGGSGWFIVVLGWL